ncbi:SAC3 domain-containing protein 1-like isoform X2 [Ptychodera flava]|uniref:SAC3 domain-containing protein 1-like isoform X2 n=1 Tax=Ptychodera flava TaxID=63121 RepID=UPI00396A6D46
MTHVQSKWTTEESAMCEKFVNPKVGKCMDMCPKNEIVDREKQRRIHPFEMVPGTRRDQRPKADPERMVKEYCRSAAGKAEPSEEELRPPNVLMKTVKYLVNRLLTREDVKWLEIYNFVFDRMRCIRQDMVLQQLSPVHCIELLEPIVRFYIYAGYRLHHEQIHSYDPHINNSHIQQCLQKLLICYDDECQKAENRAEFESLYLLHNLGSVEASFHVIALPKYLRYALETLNAAYSSKNTKFPINILKQWLKFNSDEDAIKFVSMFGLTVVDGMVHYSRAAYSAPMQQPNVGSHCHLDSIDLSGEEIADVIWNKYTEP